MTCSWAQLRLALRCCNYCAVTMPPHSLQGPQARRWQWAHITSMRQSSEHCSTKDGVPHPRRHPSLQPDADCDKNGH